MLITKIGKYKLIKWYDSSELQYCEAQRCKEDLNGFNYFCLEIGTKFKLGIWLCDKHAKELIKKIKCAEL